MSGCECKPDAERKRGSAQPQARAQPLRTAANTSPRTRLASSEVDTPAAGIGSPIMISTVPPRTWYVAGARIARDPRMVTDTNSALDLDANMNPPPLNGLILPSRLVPPSGKIRIGASFSITAAASRRDLTAACGFSLLIDG